MIDIKSDNFVPVLVPAEIADCPKCDGKLYVAECDEWETETGLPLCIHTECEHEPDIDEDEWEEWFDWHYEMPYVDWLPVDEIVLEWFQKNYRIMEAL